MALIENYHTVARLGDIREGCGLPVALEGRTIALFLEDGRFFAIDDACPHQGVPLCEGIVYERSVSCTWHGWRFSLEDGRWLDSPGAGVRAGTYPVRVVGEDIQVSLG